MEAGRSQLQSGSLQDTPEDLSVKEGNSNSNINNSNKSALRQHLDQAPSGLSLLVAALDAQSNTPQDRRTSHELTMDSSNSEASISPSPSMSADGTGGDRGSRRRQKWGVEVNGHKVSSLRSTTTRYVHHLRASLVIKFKETKSDNEFRKWKISPRCSPIPDVHKDETYWEKRRRNNDAAKRSREKRRLNDMVMEQRLLELSKENTLLKNELTGTRVCLPPSPVVVAPKIEPALPTATTPLLFTANQPALFDLPGAPAAKIPNLSLITNNGSGNLPSALIGGSNQHLNLAPTSSQHLNLAAGQNLNLGGGQSMNLPSGQLHPSLFASVLPPHSMLQLYQAQIQAAIAVQQQQQQQQNRSLSTGLLSVGNGSAFQPFSNGNGHLEQQHVSPDSSTVDGAKLTTGTDQSSSCLDGKQYLRYKLLERQNRRSSSDSVDMTPIQQPAAPSSSDQSSSASTNNDRPQSLLGSLLSNRRSSPSVLQSRTERESGLATTSSSCSSSSAPSLNTDLKHCLSSLAVHLTTAKSDSSDSMASPSSSRGAESTNSSHSQPSPSDTVENGAILKALRSKIGSTENVGTERYVERRKRNNEAAKRCRANRRALFEFRFKRTQQLEQENTLLRDDIDQLTKEVMQLKEQLIMQQQRSARLDSAGRCDTDYIAALPTQAAGQKNKEMLDMTSAAQEASSDPHAGEHSTSPSADSGHHDSGSEAEDGAKLSIAESI